MQGTSISGRKKNDGIDFYKTPEWAIRKLLENYKLEGPILEPSSGSGAISKVLEECGHYVVSQDIRTDDGVYGHKGMDFFTYDVPFKTIITNPPYFCAREFVDKALTLGDNVVMLLKLSFLESAERYDFFHRTPLKYVYVFSKRITMYPEGEPEPKNSGTIAYAWYIWEKGYMGEPIIRWIL